MTFDYWADEWLSECAVAIPRRDGFRWVPSTAPKKRSSALLWVSSGGVGCLGFLCLFTVVLFLPGLFLMAFAVALAIIAVARH